MRLVRRSYAVCAATAVLAGSIFVLGQPIWAPDLAYLSDHLWFAAGFVLCNVILGHLHHAGPSIDGVAPGGARSGCADRLWPAQDWSFGLSRRRHGGGLPLLRRTGFGRSLVVSTLVSSRLATRSNMVLRRRPGCRDIGSVRRRGPLLDADRARRYGPTPIARTRSCWNERGRLLLLVVHDAYCLYLVTSNFGSALVVEASRDLGRLGFLARRTMRNAFALVCPAVWSG